VSSEMLKRLALTYGTEYDSVLQALRNDPAMAQPIGLQCSISGAEILHAVQHEAAVRLSDALIRRTEAGSAGHPGTDALERAAAIMAAVLGWDEWRRHHEIAEGEAFYRLPA
jgi:glycerol-3-phosphate dehydrogenase